MSENSYTATLIGNDSTETIELELIGGLPQKSFVRAISDSAETDSAETDGASTDGAADGAVDEVVWELVPGEADGHTYRPAGIPGADYS